MLEFTQNVPRGITLSKSPIEKVQSYLKSQGIYSHFIPAQGKADPYLTLVLHGRGDSIVPFMNFNEELQISKMNYLLINAPRKYLRGYSWYGEPPYQANGVLRMRQILLNLIKHLEDAGFSPHQIFLFGFSQGCLISADLALHSTKALGGFIGISGYFHFFPQWRRHMSPSAPRTPWLLTHGIRDKILPLEETKFGVRKIKEAGIDINFVELNKAHTLEEDEYPIIRKWLYSKMSR